MKFYGSQLPVWGITVSRKKEECQERIRALVDRTSDFLACSMPLAENEIVIKDAYIGPGYAIPTAAGNAAIRKVARLEGIFLDPVYTGKTMAGLIDLVQQGEIRKDSTVVFWHTGGVPGIFGLSRALG
jgi:1-aminocyclopropane-1-carboxylate deaminase/D-cysteine desulfhydrase-like pyridoxal-dependent ACC family enzyme